MAATPKKPKAEGLQTNMGVDYVITYRYADLEKDAAISKFQKLVETLAGVGLATEVRPGENHSVLVFLKVASEDHLFGEVYRSR